MLDAEGRVIPDDEAAALKRMERLGREIADSALNPAPPCAPTPLESKNPGIPEASPPLQIRLPWPPTVNHYWLPSHNGKLYISKAGQSFRAQVRMLAHGMPMLRGPVAISIAAHPPDRRRRDLDNILKACLDALQHAALIEDDSLVHYLLIQRLSVIKGGAVAVTINRWE